MLRLTELRPVRFGVFEVDFTAGELRKRGVKIRLHEQPFKVLCMLLERPGEVVTREELHAALWPDGTYTDSDLGLNSAVMKLRSALGDAAGNPRFIETLPRRGYRLIVPVVGTGALVDAQAPEPLEQLQVPVPSPQQSTAGVQTAWVRKAALGLVMLLVVSFGTWHYFRRPTSAYSIAVLPLVNLTPGADGDYFADGLTDEIISNLSVIDGLQVKSQTSSFSFKNKPRDVHAVGDQLSAGYVLEGSVLRENEKLRVNVQLVRVADDHPIWSGRFERQLSEIFSVQDEISRSIVNELRLKLGRGERRYNTDLETYNLYLKARALSNQSPGVDAKQIASSIPVFEAAVARDSNFAPAYAGIADAYSYLSSTSRTFSPELAFIRMQEACERARLLDPLLADAFACMGLVHSREYAWRQAEEDYTQAFRLNPNLARAHEDFAMWVLFPAGRLQEAERQLRIGKELDPLNPRVLTPLNMILLAEHRYDEVVENCRKALSANPSDPYLRQLLGRALVQKGQISDGTQILEQLGAGSEQFLAYAYGKQGRRADAERVIREHTEFPWIEALGSSAMDDRDRAAKALDRMAAMKDPRFGFYPYFPELASVRGSERVNELRAQQGLPAIR